MRSCHECGSDVADQDIFCPYCGLSLERVESVEAEVPVEDDAELESTIMMTPEAAAKLGNEITSAPDLVAKVVPETSDSEVISEDAQVEVVPEPAAVIPEDVLEQVEEEEFSFDDIPPPAILSSTGNTSDNISTRDTSEHIGAASVEFSKDDSEALDLDATIVGSPFAMPGDEPRQEVASDPDAIITAESPRVEAEELPIQSASEDNADLEPIIEERAEDTHVEPKVQEDEMISMPKEELNLPDPFASNSMFDSVRIIEGQNPFAQEDIATRVPDQLQPVSQTPAAVPVQVEAEKPETSTGIGASDTDGRRSSKLKPLREGTILNGRYEIVRKIGGGGMGAVYLASDSNLGGVLRAVKEMVQSHIEEDQQDKAIADFKRESMILSTLDHPSIPTIFDYFYDDHEGRFYLVMKYISGGDLSSRLRAVPEGKLDEKTVVEWAIQITDVLDYLHNQPSTVVYRDLKPSNIMIDGNSGRVMLIDFGIARSIGQREEKGVTAVGTMGYAPPELFSGNVEPRSDIYSLGSTMFHLLTGADPQSNPLLIFDFQKNPRPRQINPRITDQIEEILMRSVEYNSDARYSTAAELKAVLTEHCERLKAGRVTYGVGAAPVSVSLSNQQVFCGFCGQRIVATDMFCAFCGAKQPMAQQGVHSEIYSSAPRTARLLIEGTAELTAPTYLLQKDENLVGRRDPMSNIFPEVDLSKYDPQTKISRRHARIWRDGQLFHVEDLGSSNGTILTSALRDSYKLPPHKPHAISHGDKLKIGDTILHFVVN